MCFEQDEGNNRVKVVKRWDQGGGRARLTLAVVRSLAFIWKVEELVAGCTSFCPFIKAWQVLAVVMIWDSYSVLWHSVAVLRIHVGGEETACSHAPNFPRLNSLWWCFLSGAHPARPLSCCQTATEGGWGAWTLWALFPEAICPQLADVGWLSWKLGPIVCGRQQHLSEAREVFLTPPKLLGSFGVREGIGELVRASIVVQEPCSILGMFQSAVDKQSLLAVLWSQRAPSSQGALRGGAGLPAAFLGPDPGTCHRE